MRVALNQDPYNQGAPLFARDSFILNPGLSFIVGCNGSGKSALIDEIGSFAKANPDNVIINYSDYAKDTENQSEGQTAADTLYAFMDAISNAVGAASKGDCIVALADLSHSGLTAEHSSVFKNKINSKIVSEAESNGIELYIAVAATDFEYLLDQTSIDVQTFNVLVFNNYTGYRKYVLNSKIALDKRYAKMQTT